MKAINKTRNTKSFCIGAVDIESIAKIFAKFPNLVAIAHDDKNDDVNTYTIRIANNSRIEDMIIDCCHTEPRVVERHIVQDFKAMRQAMTAERLSNIARGAIEQQCDDPTDYDEAYEVALSALIDAEVTEETARVVARQQASLGAQP